ncbi:hypothetical protein SALB1_0332 [Salinisphaera sp. LB1]|nr:hypothetical protein SALB1_0332 [Salinisphaera sp. LB1]
MRQGNPRPPTGLFFERADGAVAPARPTGSITAPGTGAGA